MAVTAFRAERLVDPVLSAGRAPLETVAVSARNAPVCSIERVARSRVVE